MLTMVVRDLQWRRRRFVLAGLATALVFAVTLLLTGVATSVHNECRRTVERFAGDTWLVLDGDAGGPFTGARTLPVAMVEAVAAAPGVTRADPVIILRGALAGDPVRDINLIGVPPGTPGEPEAADGVGLAGPGQALVDEGLDLDLGESFALGGHDLVVVGEAERVAFTFGIPTVFVALEEAQRIATAGAPLAGAIVVQGELAAGDIPPGLVAMDPAEVLADLERPLARGTDSIDLVRVLLTITAAGIVGLIVYLSTIERMADLAVLKATGSPKWFMAGGLAIQAVILSIAAAVVSVALAAALGPLFPVPLEVTSWTYVELFGLALVVGVLASGAGVGRAIRVDPAAAFGGR